MVASACLIIGKVEEGKKDLATMVGYYLLVASSQEEKIHQQAGLHCYFSLEVSLFFFSFSAILQKYLGKLFLLKFN